VPEEVLIVETNRAGNGVMALRAAQALGYRAHFVTSSLDQYAGMTDHPADAADRVSEVDTYDVAKLLRFRYGRRPAAVLAFDDFRAVQAAILAEHLGVRTGPSAHALVNVRRKDRMRACLARTRHHVRFSVHDLDDDVRSDVGFPCVVKPVDGSGSVAVRVCRRPAELREAVASARAHRDHVGVAGYRIDRLIVEEELDGEEFSAEMVWDAGTSDWRLVGITKSYLSEPPHRIELGHLFPYPLGPAPTAHVAAELRDILNTLGLRGTIVHLEFRLDGDRVRIIEVNPRPAGGRITELTRAARDVDLTVLHLLAHLGRGLPAEPPSASPEPYAAVRFFVPARPGRIAAIVLPPVDDARIVATGAAPTPLRLNTVHDNDARIAYAVAVGATVDEAETVARRYVTGVKEIR
jgi:biotin carboxylase